VQSSGTLNKLPRGWTSVLASTGVYTITHNLGLPPTNYAVTGLCQAAPGARHFSGVALSSNSFEVYVTDAANAVANSAFCFELSVI
jgi:hypothetical protein